MAKRNTRGGRSASSSSIIGGNRYHLSVSYLRSRQGGSSFRRPSAQQLRAGMSAGHPRPSGRSDDDPGVQRPAKPGTQTDE